MDINTLIASLDESTYLRLKQAVETGKWQDGTALTEEQKQNSLQIVIAWQAKHLQQTQHMSVGADGELVMLDKQQLKHQFKSDQPAPIARFQQDDF